MESLRGQFLVAMPGMGDERFHETVVYIVGHGEEGAMGLVVNQPVEDMRFADILDELGIAGKDDENIQMPSSVRDREVLRGGPVQRGRGFVLHSPDYFREENTYEVSDDICLTATLDILKSATPRPTPSSRSAIAAGRPASSRTKSPSTAGSRCRFHGACSSGQR